MLDLIQFQHFHFLRPYWLLVTIPVIFIVLSFSRRDDSMAFWKDVMSKEIIAKLTVSGTGENWLTPKTLLIAVALVASLVLAGPTWRQQNSPFTEDKSALIIALDVSQTMNQSDVAPSRLLRAKQKIIELLALRGDANTALIAFSGSAHTVMPITNDSEMIRHFLDSLDNQLMPTSGKRPQAVLSIASKLFEPTVVPGTLLLMGDGGSAETVSEFANFFESQSHQLIVWAFGKSSRVEQKGDLDESVSSIIPMQLSQLESLVDNSHGRLVMMSHDKQDVQKVYQSIENNLVIVENSSRPWLDSGYPLVYLMALLFLFWFRRGWTLQW
ncbi:MAG: Ca-activated chloride channel family protein [Enterobacterales bacterium]|jgi:Ca-activated chloride channel family protein